MAFVLFLALMSGVFTFDSMPPLFAEIGRDIEMNNTQAGLIMSAFHFASPIFTPIGGLLADRYGTRRVLAGAAIILAVAGALRMFSDSVLLLSAFMFLSGVGFASFGPCIAKSLGEVFPKDQLARASGFVYSGIGIGNMIAFGTAAAVFSPMLGGWREVMLLIAAYTLAVGVLWFLLFRSRPVQTEEQQPGSVAAVFGEIFSIASNKSMWALSAFYALPMFAYSGALSHVGPLLGERGVENPGFYFALLTGASALSNIAGGAISDWLGRRKPVLLVCSLGLAAMLPLLVTLEAGLLLMGVAIMAGVFFGPLIPISVIIPVELKDIGSERAGAALGFMFMVGNIGAILGPILIGLILDATHSAQIAIALPVAALLATAIPLKFLSETGVKRSAVQAA